MSFCPYKSKLTAYRLELLDKSEIKEIEGHVKQCAQCQQEMALDTAIEKTLSETMAAGEIETLVLRRVRALKEIPFPASIFSNGLFRIIFHTVSAIGLAYALLIYLGKMITLERVSTWLTWMVDILSSISLVKTEVITIASIVLSMAIFCSYYFYRIKTNR